MVLLLPDFRIIEVTKNGDRGDWTEGTAKTSG